MNTSRATLFAPLAITVALMSGTLAMAEESYPSRPVKIVVPVPAGSSPDARTRIIADQLTKTWGQQAVVENRPGGGGSMAVRGVLSVPADGYTLLAAPTSIYAILPAQADKPAFDASRDLVPIGLIGHEALVIAVSPKLGINSLAGLIALARKDPHKIIIGTNPAGTLPHLAARLLVELSKAPFTVLPYATGGTNEAIKDILGGRVHAVIEARPGLRGGLDSGDLKAVAIMSTERLSILPDLPTAAEDVPGLTAIGWMALVAPNGTPEAIIQQLERDLRKALQDPQVQARIEQVGTPFRPLPAADLVRFIEAEQKLWWPIVKGAGPR
jgi:tripartite-type tricarboxylate transporter receptor subunit TctC